MTTKSDIVDRAAQMVVSAFNGKVVGSSKGLEKPQRLDPEKSAVQTKSEALDGLKRSLQESLSYLPDAEAAQLARAIAEADRERGRRGAPSLLAKPGEISEHFLELEAALPRLWTAQAYLDRPRREQLLEGLIAEQSLAFLVGPSGSGKTLMAIDWGACLAIGRGWHDRSSKRSRVLYIAAEGLDPNRIKAWQAANDISVPETFLILNEPVNLFTGSDGSMIESLIVEYQFDLVILDTLARAMVGGDEDKARDVNRLIWVFDRWRAAGAAVLGLHHTGHRIKHRERGSSAIRAAADDLFLLKSDGRRIEMRPEKRRDGPLDEPIALEITPVAGTDGVVLTPSRGPTPLSGPLTKNEAHVLSVLEEGDDVGLTYNAWWEASELAKSSFDNSRKTLILKGLTEKTAHGRGTRYTRCRPK